MHGCKVLAAALLAAACMAGNATARESRAAFQVRVRLMGTGHAANIPKSAASAGELSFALSTHAGYLVRFEVMDPAVALVKIHGVGSEIRIASGTKEVFVPSSQAVISYSVQVRPGAELSVSPAVRATLLP